VSKETYCSLTCLSCLKVSAIIREFYRREKLVCALGAGILVLKAANVLYAHKVSRSLLIVSRSLLIVN